ncbi:MAG: diguanylate cyclase/phosphodiesterase with sensor(s) [Burkholderiaceae bacterium]|nr:diguanylate cyclase/phosphodiesterase with sensor(s) [Burkholderiaceae bacterium]
MEQSDVSFEDLFVLDEIQRIQDEFASATQVASIITRPDGTPITAPSNFTRFCRDVVRKTEKGLANCQASDAELGCGGLSGPIVKPCWSAGLWDAGVPIIVAGHHVGNWLIGQVRDETQTEESALAYAEQIGADKVACINAYRDIPIMPVAQFEKVAQALFTLASQLSRAAFQNVLLARSEAKLRQLAAEQQAILDGADYSIISTDTNGTILSFNKAAQRMLGYLPEEVIGKKTPELIHDRREMAERARELSSESGTQVQPNFEVLVALPKRGLVDEREWSFIDKAGRRFPVRLSISPLRGPEGQITGYMGIAADLGERKQAEAELRDSEMRYRALFEGVGEGIFLMLKDRFVDCNPAILRIFGCQREDIIGATPFQYSPRVQPDGRASVDVAHEKIAGALGGDPQFFEWQHLRQDGAPFDAAVTLSAVEIGGVPHLLATVRDITERKRSAAKIRHLAYYDQLTRIPNRSLLLDRLGQEIRECRTIGMRAALLLIDVLSFNLINNSLGHINGDQLLQQIAHRLGKCSGEAGMVARLSADTFALLLPKVGDTESATMAGVELVAQQVFRQFEKPFNLDGIAQHCNVAVGATIFGSEVETPEALLREVELAVQEGKRQKDNAVKFYVPALQSLASKRAQIEESLRQAIEQKEFVLHYQPQLSGGRLVGLEALIRWQHPEKGMVPPGDFIPVAEETRLIIPIGEWVIREACEQIKQWATHPVLAGVSIAVNIATAQIALPNFVERVLNIIAQTNAPPQLLKLELTESALALDSDSVVEKMRALRMAGIQFSLDDFGTGYSSLSYLKRLPINQIKIDQSFVRDLLTDKDDAMIAKTIVNLAIDFGMEVIAEGVETEAQQAFLEQLGCHAFQGYLYARPMPASDLEAFSVKFA